MSRICIVPRVEGPGGMASFRIKIEAGLARRGIEVTHDLSEHADAILVVGGTRDVRGLWRARRRGARLVHRLDGINWIHRVRRTTPRLWLRSESANLLLAFIRRRLADHVVYQSEFVRDWWLRRHGSIGQPTKVIYNGVDLETYTPAGPETPPLDRVRVMVVEGSLAEGQEAGLPWALDFGRALQERTITRTDRPVEVVIAARVRSEQQSYWTEYSAVPVTFLGLVSREHIPALDRSAHIYFSAEVNPPCPNSVIEALACGLPVAGFAMGALPELVTPDAGCLVEYGGDPWKLDAPNISALADAAADLLIDLPHYRAAARGRAESLFGLDVMVERYLEVLLG